MAEVVFLCRQDWEHYYDNIVPHLKLTYEYVYDWKYLQVLERKPSVIISVFSIPPEITALIPRCKEAGIATLQLQDGVIEWRHSWDNPALVRQAPPRFRPSMFDKIGVFGPLYRRLLESWGNLGKCEIVGVPRWDNVEAPKGEPREGRKFRLLLASARNPGFDKAQIDIVIRAFRDLLDYLETRPEIEVSWRVNKAIEKEIRLQNSSKELNGCTAEETLSAVDAVICTPSTFLIEAMLSHCPVASLDYHVTPQYLHPAWTIHCKTDIEPVIRDLETAPRDKMMFQEFVCSDAVFRDGSAGERAARLIHELSTWAGNGRCPEDLPAAILEETMWPPYLPPKGLSLKTLFPDHPMFKQQHEYEMRAELTALRNLQESYSASSQSSTEKISRKSVMKKTVSGIAKAFRRSPKEQSK